MRSSSHRRTTHLPQHGFTLLEIIIALGLSLVLLAAIGASLNIYWRFTSTGQAQVERAQLSRAILKQMELDIRATMFQPAEDKEESEEQAADVESESVTIQSVTNTTDAYTTTSVGLVGDSTSIVVHINRPPRDMGYSAIIDQTSLAQPSSDLLSVSYFLAERGADGLAGAVGQGLTPTSNGLLSSARTVALAKLTGDRFAVELANSASDTGSLAAASTILSPEVNLLTFRYFDGIEWFDQWSTEETNALPQAVEITIGFIPEDCNLPPDFRNTNAPTSSGVRRHVVWLPLAQPFAGQLAI